MNSKIYVIAGDIRQFRTYVNNEGKGQYHKYQYLASREQLLGLHGIKVVYYGTYQDNPVYQKCRSDIYYAMLPCESIVKKIIRKIKGYKKS